MIYLFFFIIVILLLAPMILLSFVTNILSLFGLKMKKNSSNKKSSKWNDSSAGERSTNVKGGNRTNRKKIFEKNEGEYVDFEEIK